MSTGLVLGVHQSTGTPPVPSLTIREQAFIHRAEKIFQAYGLNDIRVEIKIAPIVSGIKAKWVTYNGSLPKSKYLGGEYRSASRRISGLAKKYNMMVFVNEAFDNDRAILSFPEFPEPTVDTIDFEL